MNYYQQEIIRIRNCYFPRQEILDRLADARRLMSDQLCSAPDLDRLAATSCLSKYHFMRLFKNCYGRTPGQHLAEMRAGHAVQLLKRGYSVFETACALGFDSSTSFTKFFRKHTGQTPASVAKRAILDSCIPS